MVVVDTSAWIEMLLGNKIGLVFRESIKDEADIVVPTIVQLELAKWALREDGIKKAQELVAYSNQHTVVPLDTAIASHAAFISREHRLHTTDAIIYATAQLLNAKLYTCDAHFKDLPGVEYCEK
jgi:predicted nucleic acid-binding protein